MFAGVVVFFFNFVMCWCRSLCFIESVFWVFSATAVSGTFSVFSITAAFLPFRNQNFTCYTIFRIIVK